MLQAKLYSKRAEAVYMFLEDTNGLVSNDWRPIGREQSDAKGDASNRNNQSKKKNMYVNLQLCVMFLDVHELLDSSPFVTDTSQGI